MTFNSSRTTSRYSGHRSLKQHLRKVYARCGYERLFMKQLSHERPAEGVLLARRTSWVMGLDLGQSIDATAIAVVEHISGVLNFNSEFERHTNIDPLPTKRAQKLNVRHLQRLPTGLPYPEQVEIVKELLARPPLCGDGKTPRATLVIDNTGVGRAVGDIFTVAGLKHQGVTITAGSEVTSVGRDRWNVSKSHLISSVDALLNTGELKFAADLAESSSMKEELANFRRKLSDAGRATYAARTGASDDLVLAVAIACWWAARPPPPVAQFGSYSYT